MSEAVEFLIAMLGAGLICVLFWWFWRWDLCVWRTRRDAPKVGAAVSHIEQHGVSIPPGEKLKPHSQRWTLPDTAAKNPQRYGMNPQRPHRALAQYDPWMDDIKKDIGKRSWWMSI